jgi:hypothetical protein
MSNPAVSGYETQPCVLASSINAAHKSDSNLKIGSRFMPLFPQVYSMGTIAKRGAKYQAQVCIKGQRRSKTFAQKGDAARWILRLESDADAMREQRRSRGFLGRWTSSRWLAFLVIAT